MQELWVFFLKWSLDIWFQYRVFISQIFCKIFHMHSLFLFYQRLFHADILTLIRYLYQKSYSFIILKFFENILFLIQSFTYQIPVMTSWIKSFQFSFNRFSQYLLHNCEPLILLTNLIDRYKSSLEKA